MHNRLFKLWYYTVSHKQMLLRGIGNGGIHNIDIYFGDVSYAEIPMEMKGVEILEATQEDIDYITQKIGYTNKKVIVLISEKHKYFVVASIIKIIENDLSMFELPFDIPNDMGEVYNQ